MKPSERKIKPSLKTSDFRFYKILGNGNFAHVVSAKFISKRPTEGLKHGEMYALKIVSKLKLLVSRKAESVVTEKRALKMLSHRNVIKLHGTFQDETSLYFVLELANSPSLLSILRKTPEFPLDLCRKIIAELINALQYIHEHKIIHRDIKPDNILFSSSGHLKLADFGSCKILERETRNESVSRHSFVGTAAYIAPEVINGEETTFECDLWSLGCTIYQILTGKESPFAAKSEYLSLKHVLTGDIAFPPGFDENAKNLIWALLRKNPSERLGSPHSGGFKVLRSHPFFAGLNFENILYENLSFIDCKVDTENFDDFNSSEEMSSKNSTSGVLRNNILTRSYDFKLAKNESVVFSGLIEKRKSILNHRRELILTNKPRLLYFDPKTGSQKGEVQLRSAFSIEPSNDNYFLICTPNREYRFKSVNEDSASWVKVLNNAILKILNLNQRL